MNVAPVEIDGDLIFRVRGTTSSPADLRARALRARIESAAADPAVSVDSLRIAKGETPWRQVEAMLQLAAERTPGLLKEPKPFVLYKALGDFAVTYELNVYCGDAREMNPLYAALSRNILDVFNEYGVQIMTPAYEGDPAQAKVVACSEWFLAPAQPPPGEAASGGPAAPAKITEAP